MTHTRLRTKAQATTAALSVDELCLGYGDTQICNSISFRIYPGEIFALVGPNGAGKSTIVKAITTRISPISGEIKINGGTLTTRSVKYHIGIAPQKPALFDKLTAVENVVIAGCFWGMKRPAAKERAYALLRQFDLNPEDKKIVSSYSGGMRQRVNIAASIVHSPSLLILDEPNSSLDPMSGDAINQIIANLRDDGLAILLISHDLRQVQALATKVGVLADGKIIAIDAPDMLIRTHAAPSLAVSIKIDPGIDASALRNLGFVFKKGVWQNTTDNYATFSALLTDLQTQQKGIRSIEARHADLKDAIVHLLPRSKREVQNDQTNN